jgi:ribosome biogenesis protein UTP30
VASELVEKFVPQKWTNVRSLYIKGPETAALPIWQTEELWADDALIVTDDQAPRKVLPGAKQAEKANTGKKRKSLETDAAADKEAEKEAEKDEAAAEERPKKKTKTAAKKGKEAPVESNDDKLDQQISERKAALKKQKKAARKALEA